MRTKNLHIEFLLDFYGEVLNERTRAVLGAYYGEDLSLAEIAEEEGISRQGVRQAIKRGEEELLFLEERLGLAAKHRQMTDCTERITLLAKKLENEYGETGAALFAELRELLQIFEGDE